MAAAATAVPLVMGMPALATAPDAAAALKPIVTLALYPGRNTDDHGGVMCTGTRTCQPVSYPYLERSAGAEDLQSAVVLDTSDGPIVVFGYSQGARVVSQWLEEYADAPGARTPDQLSIVLIGNPDRKHGGAHVHLGQITPETQYDVLDISREYDMASDWPDRPLNLLALANAYAGMRYIHIDYAGVDIYDPGNYVWKEGNTTYVFVPTENIPLLEPLRRMGLDALADQLNAPLKAKIDRAYDRSYLPATPGWPAELLPPKTDTPQPDPTPTTLTAARTLRSSAAADGDTVAGGDTSATDDAAKVTDDLPSAEPDPADNAADETADDTADDAAESSPGVAEGSGAEADKTADTPARKRPFGGRLLGRHAHPTASADTPSAAS